MNKQLTLDELYPHDTTTVKIYKYALWIFVIIVLSISYKFCGIDPYELISKKNNAIIYLFGHDISEKEKTEAKRQAQKLPAIIAVAEARREVREKMQVTGENNPITFAKKVQTASKEYLSSMSSEEKYQIIDSEYQRLLDEKRGGYFPPELRIAKLKIYLKSLVETIAMAIWGTILAFILAVPISMFAASNSLKLFISGDNASSQRARNTIQFFTRRFLDFCRGFNEFVMALIFVAVIGLGPFAGVLALAVHTLGVLGKVFSEGIEAIDPGQVEAVEASGSSPVQTISFAIIPQIMPLIVSYSLLRFESNVRSASILGFVGAGGIGYLIFDKINGYMYREVCTIMILVIITVTIIDYFCGKLRKKFV